MLNWINVKELKELGLEEKKALGRMRLDWSGSRRDEVCNQWFPSQQFEEVMAQSDISIPLLPETLSELIFNQLDVFGKVIEKCGGTGYSYEQFFKVETSAFNFFVRLKPVRDEYSYVVCLHQVGLFKDGKVIKKGGKPMASVNRMSLRTEFVYSDDKSHRYIIRKEWDKTKPKATIIMINPSHENELEIDHTTMNVINNSNRLGYGAVDITNLFSLICPKISYLQSMNELVHEENDIYIEKSSLKSDMLFHLECY